MIPEATVGPYQTVLLDGRSRGQHLDEWLPANGYAIPEGGRAAVAHYTALNAGWVVLRLRPGEGVSRMSPVRIALDGYHASFPLRMIASGSGDSVGIALLVASNGAMRDPGLPESAHQCGPRAWAAGAPDVELRKPLSAKPRTHLSPLVGHRVRRALEPLRSSIER